MSEFMRNRRKDETDGFFCRFTFGQFFALLVLEVFTIFFVFYLGARYGGDFLGLDRGEGAAQVVAPEEAKVLTTADPEGVKAARELIAKAKTPELKDRIRQMIEGAGKDKERRLPPVVERKAPVEEEVKEESAAEVMERPEPLSAEGKVEETKVKDAAEASAATDSSVIRVKSADNARYSVQVGSFPNMKEATRAVERWKEKGYPAYMMIADIPDRGRWYRVRLGGFQTRGDADVYLKELKTRENVEALVVLNEQ